MTKHAQLYGQAASTPPALTRIPLAALHPAQQTIYDSMARFRVVSCGRRFGKTEIAKRYLIDGALAGYPVAYFAPTYRMLADVWRALKSTLHAEIADRSETEHRIELNNGGIIECWSLTNPDTVRGRKYERIVVDEAALIKDAEAWPAVLRPLLTDFRGSALFVSTPRGKNWFWHLYNLGNDPFQTDWQSFQFPTSANPYIAPDEIEAARQLLPARIFTQEYEAVFGDNVNSVFRGVAQCAVALPQTEAAEGHHIVAGADFGRSGDFTVVSVMDTATKTQLYLDRFTGVEWSLQRERIKAICERFRVHRLSAESNSFGGPNIEALQRDGVPVEAFSTTAQSKGPLIESLALAIEQGEITLLNDPVLIAELESYEQELLSSGRYRYGPTSGVHDDTVIATALSWYAADHFRYFGGIHL